MGKNLYIADLHFGHEKILWLDNRPFKTVQEMDDALIRNWQQTVQPDDTVYVLGDMFWKTVPGIRRSEIMAALPGKKILVRGNHDVETDIGWHGAENAMTVKDGKDSVYLSHYPTLAFPDFYKGAVHLYAHVHVAYEADMAEKAKSVLEELYGKPCRMYNVGCMMPWMSYAPQTLDAIEKNYAKCRLNAAYGYKPETCSMLTLSSGHISRDTAEKLNSEGNLNDMGLSVYPKATMLGESFGWYIYIPADCDNGNIPCELKRCIEKARSLGCKVLCLDCDGSEDPSLERFDW